jgi:hypothetical protein
MTLLTKPLTVLFLVIALGNLQAQPKISVAFTLPEKDLIPEGIAYNPVDKSFYVGSIHKHKVVKVNSKGVVSDFITSGQDGVGNVLGMKVDARQNLWFCSNPPHGTMEKSAVFQYDVVSGKLIQKYELTTEEKHELNDLQFFNNEVYITDSALGAIYKIVEGKVELFLQSDLLRFSNGITLSPDGKRLLVSTGSGIVSVNPDTRETTRVEAPFYILGIDGLYTYNQSLIAIQNVLFPTALVQYHLNHDFTGISRASLLAVNHPSFDIPTTGVVVGDWFYFIGNSQLLQVVGNEGKIKNPETLKEVVILKVPLR